jgi:hypothetical protein
LSQSTRNPQIADATSALFIGGFDALDLNDYLPLLNLKPNY